MMKDVAWNIFKSTGNVDVFLKLKQIENLEKNNVVLEQKVDSNEYSKNEGNNNFGK